MSEVRTTGVDADESWVGGVDEVPKWQSVDRIPAAVFWMDAVVLGLAGYWYGDV